jgi:uncharacterized protein (TIGR00290 family)
MPPLPVLRPKALVSWSSGKDSAFALHEVRRAGELEVVGLLTSITSEFGRVSMHGVREELLDRQTDLAGLVCHKVRLPWPCPNEVYEREMRALLDAAKMRGVTHVVFGDLFLEDIRVYREARMAEAGMTAVFPLWGRPTAALVDDMLAAGVEATITCLDPKKLDRSFTGRAIDRALLDALPARVDPCGENGEFHTFVTAGPMLRGSIAVSRGDVVERDGFVFADLLPS